MTTFLLVVLIVLCVWILHEVVNVNANQIAASQAHAIIAAKIDGVSERLDRMEDDQSLDDVDDLDDVDVDDD